MKLLVPSLTITIAFLAATPNVLTLAAPSSATESARTTPLVAYQTVLQPATQGGTISEQLHQLSISQMPTAPAVPPEQPKTMTTPAKTNTSQSSSVPNNSYPGCAGVEESKASTDSFSYLEALRNCKFGS